jgi:hypothetical protein
MLLSLNGRTFYCIRTHSQLILRYCRYPTTVMYVRYFNSHFNIVWNRVHLLLAGLGGTDPEDDDTYFDLMGGDEEDTKTMTA